jgi:hypothetical protein
MPTAINRILRMSGIAAFRAWSESGDTLRIGRLEKLRTEFRKWPKEHCSVERVAIAAEISEGKAVESVPDWDALFRVESALIIYLPIEDLVAKLQTVKSEFTEIAGRARSEALFNSFTFPATDPAKSDEKLLRAYATEALSEIQELTVIRYGYLAMRTRLVSAALVILFLLVLSLTIFSGIPYATTGSSKLTAIEMLAIVGMVGGGISSVSRVFNLGWSAELAGGLDDLKQTYRSLLLNVFTSILQGGLFALVLYVAFASGLIQGVAFPTFNPDNKNIGESALRYFEYGPASHAQFGKALIWAFVAGFSERLVPDFLRSLSATIKSSS